MKKYLTGFWYSLPIQLFLLHFKRYQIFLVFWYILFATIDGNFMRAYGAYSLYLAPEYLGQVSVISSIFVGVAIGIFIMSWNITTFILHGRLIKFLATTAQPFLKYCINNAVLPIIFLLFYFVKAVQFDKHEELLKTGEIAWLISGFLMGFILSVLVAFIYFFSADKTIYKSYASVMNDARKQYDDNLKTHPLPAPHRYELRVDWFLSAKFHLRKPRDVRHYSDDFLDAIFKRHHLAAVFAILFAFISLIVIGFYSDRPFFQIPAAASITIFFAILIAVSGAFTVFLKNWSIPALVAAYLIFNYLYVHEIFDPRNKAYGLDYSDKNERARYDRKDLNDLADNKNMQDDRNRFLQVLKNWKEQQKETKPVLFIINVSGGGARSATFAMNSLQRIDSMLNGELMQHTILINGASGGMLGAAYFRELYLTKLKGGNINLHDKQYADDISKDLLNPLFTSLVARDILGPVQHFKLDGSTYIKDRGYSFEQKLNQNTRGLLDKSLKDYAIPEEQAIIPTMLFNSVITRDARKMIICTQPARFLMRPVSDTFHKDPYDPDAIDFISYFSKQNAGNIRILSALRMNATFPYVLPNVWMPTDPVIDVMDAGLRDNYGQDNSLRFIENFREWLQENTSKVVIIQIRDRSVIDWDKSLDGSNVLDFLTKPFTLLQDNLFSVQDYYQHDALETSYRSYGSRLHTIVFQYTPTKKANAAGLSFHLTTAEKEDIAASLDNEENLKAMKDLLDLVNKK
ncbi:hypothetical protein ACI6Q2_04990 [Chitinophagaceae bacterium LWZ2-11]